MEVVKRYLRQHFVEIGLPVILLSHFLTLINTGFTAWPEMLNWPYLMANGFAPYRDIAIAHNPLLLYALYVFYKTLGLSVWSLMNFTWLTILLTDILLFYVIEKKTNPRIAIFGLAFYVSWQIFYGGNGMWFDLFITPFILASYYFIYTKKYLWGGVFWALAFLTKQTAFWFLIPIVWGVIYESRFKTRQQHLTHSSSGLVYEYMLGTLMVFVPFVLLLVTYNLVSDYLFWAVKFGVFTLPGSVGQISLPSLRQVVIYFFPFVPLIYLAVGRKTEGTLLIMWTLAGIFAVYPRFETFHFQPALPFLAVSFSILLVRYFNSGSRFITNAFMFYLLISSLIVGRFLSENYHKDIRFFDAMTVESGHYIDDLTKKSESTYFLNTWESMYFTTSTLPATKPLVPHLSWYMELPGVQEKIVEDLKKELPRYIFVGEFKGGELSTYVPKLIYTHITSEYEFINVVNGISIYKRP